jgi:tetratricopeptide (TPR) repeat protein
MGDDSVDKPKERSHRRTKRPDNVIPFRLDAAFFFERALRHLDRRDLQSSLKYFRKAVEYEPDNPVNHCNLAGVLSEMGRFEESNEVLRTILEEIDSSMVECYFYMANNFANLGEYELAEEYAALYIESDPDGEFVEEAEEMLEILVDEFGGGEILRRRQQERYEKQSGQDTARRLLEEGKFYEATLQLEKMIRESPEATAPRNNLSLAYYYLGDLDRAIELAYEVLAKDPNNIHAYCNLAVYYQHRNEKQKVREILDILCKLYPLNFDHAYKLATTMGILGEHETAYRLFKQLLRYTDRSDVSLLHATAAALVGIGRLKQAKRYWMEIKQLDPKSQVADYYLEKLAEAEHIGLQTFPVSYQYHIPFFEQFRRMQAYMQDENALWKQDPLIRSSLFWALRHGDMETKLQVIQTFASIGGTEIEHVLEELLQSHEEQDMLKHFAAFVLRIIKTQHPPNEKQQQWYRQAYRIVLMSLHAIQGYMQHLEVQSLQQRVLDIWMLYMDRVEQNPPRVNKVNAWAAGLICAVLQTQSIHFRKAELAKLFGVSPATVTRVANTLLKLEWEQS